MFHGALGPAGVIRPQEGDVWQCRNQRWQAVSSVSALGTVGTKPIGVAGIQLDANGATGDFTLSLSPANITAARRWSFADRSDTVAGLGAQTFVGAQAISDTTASATTTTGALVVAGGVGVGGAAFFAGQVAVTNGTRKAYLDYDAIGWSGHTSANAYYDNRGVGSSLVIRTSNASALDTTALSILASGVVSVPGTTASTSTTTGALVAAGGIGVGGAINAGSTIFAPAATTSISSIRLPHGAAPSSPVNGDMWTTTAGLFVRINGATVGPLT